VLTLTITAPCGWLNANDRGGWRKHNSQIRAWRDAASQCARAAKLPHLQRAHVLATFRFRTAQRRDIHNWGPTAKAIMDGLIDYGLLPDDSTEYLTGPDLRVGEKTPKRAYGPVGVVVLTITEVA
jgi:hypothetical protein